MSENMKNAPNEQKVESTGMPNLMDFIKQQNEEAPKKEESKTVAYPQNKPQPPVQKKSPLEEALAKREEMGGTGMIVDNSTFQEKEEPEVIRSAAFTTEREEAFKKSIEDSDERLEVRKHVVLIQRPTKPKHYVELENELDAVKFDDNGKAYFDYYEEDANGNRKPLKPKWFVIRTEEYGPFKNETESEFSLGKTPAEVFGKKSETKAENTGDSKEETTSEETEESEEDASEEHSKLVQVLIDKTGYGISHIDFTNEERQKLAESDEILVTSVQKLDVKSLKIKGKNDNAPKRSFQQTAREHQLSDSHANVVFPISGFHAQMFGMSYGELTDVSVDPDSVDFDAMYKQITVVYNKMKNVSGREFENIDDFMKNFAYADLDMALYGLYVATFPEMQSMSLECGKASCKASFQHQYRTRELLRFNRCTDTWLDRFRKLISCAPYEYLDIQDNSPLNSTSFIEMPGSKYVIEFGPITLYEYLYNVLPIGNEESFRRMFGDNPSMSVLENLECIPAVRRILVPDGSGEYEEYTDLENMLNILGSLSLDEIKLVRSLTRSILIDCIPQFGLEKIQCPKCGTKTSFIQVNVGSLVFRAHEQLQNTTVDVKKWRLI